MFRLDQRGVTAVAVVVIVVVSSGATMATPVAVDVADVDPDHPLYGLERLGERIRMVGDEAQMKERCIEAYRMDERGKAEEYRKIFKEFVERAEKLLVKPGVGERVRAWLEREERRAGIVTDIHDVNPDHPLYWLECSGERIRKVSAEELMRERWDEYRRLVGRGKGLAYKDILKEFVERIREVAPGDVEAKRDVVRWMQEQMPGIGEVQLKLCEEILKGCREDLADLPEAREYVENLIRECEECERDWKRPELHENVRARIRLIREKIEKLAEEQRARIRIPIDVYFDVDNLITDASVTMNVEVNISIVRPVVISAREFQKELEDFNGLLAEVQAMIEGAPENVPGRRAVDRLIEVATRLKDRAVKAHDEGKTRRALALIHAANIHLFNAKRILEHACEWEPEFVSEWMQWGKRWHEIKQELEKIPENWKRYTEIATQMWQRRPLL